MHTSISCLWHGWQGVTHGLPLPWWVSYVLHALRINGLDYVVVQTISAGCRQCHKLGHSTTLQ